MSCGCGAEGSLRGEEREIPPLAEGGGGAWDREDPDPGRDVPSIRMALPHFLHFIRARLPATFASGTLNLVAQEEQLTIMRARDPGAVTLGGARLNMLPSSIL